MFEPGQRVVIRGKCLGMVISVGDHILVEELGLKAGEESRYEIPTERALEAMRPIVGRSDAERILAAARQQAKRPDDDRALAYRRAIKSGDLEAQVRLLAASYAGPQETPERQYQERLEASVFGELALALGKSHKALRAQVREAALSEPPSRALALPDMSRELAAAQAPVLEGRELIGAFAVHDKLAVGESGAEIVVPAKPGIWFAYVTRVEDDDDCESMFAIHAEHVGQLAELVRTSRTIGKTGIEGAHMSIFDEAMADDAEFLDAIGNTAFEIVEQRAAVVGLGGDGVALVKVAPADRAAYVFVDLDAGS